MPRAHHQLVTATGTVAILLNMAQYPRYCREFANVGFYVAPVPFFLTKQAKGKVMSSIKRAHPPVGGPCHHGGQTHCYGRAHPDRCAP